MRFLPPPRQLRPRAGRRLQLLVGCGAGDGPGVCWLLSEQTAGKQKPFLCPQGQAVLTRLFFPSFDTPAVKHTYSATGEVPKGFTAVMSTTCREEREENAFVFGMSQPIPSYLTAPAMGDIVSAEVGPGSRVWAEPCPMEAAKQEYDGVIEEFLMAGEKLFGPYVWGSPARPPRELRRARSASRVYTCLEAAAGRARLRQHVDSTGEDHPLHRPRVVTEAGLFSLDVSTALARRVSPYEDTHNEAPHGKGFRFVSSLALLAGDRSELDAFQQLGPRAACLEFDRWLNTPGRPPFLPDLSPGEQLMRRAEELAELWAADGLDVEATEAVGIPGQRAAAEREAPAVSRARNAERRLRWCRVVLKNDHEAEYDQVKGFLPSQAGRGRRARARGWQGHPPAGVSCCPIHVCGRRLLLRLWWVPGSFARVQGGGASSSPAPGPHVHRVPQGTQKYTVPCRATWGGSAAAPAMETSATAARLHVNVPHYVRRILGLEAEEEQRVPQPLSGAARRSLCTHRTDALIKAADSEPFP
ncbi:LOW QUALITY PROTEIN: aminopeptidase B [Eudromia elegans]